MSDFESTRRSQPTPTSGVLAIVLAVVAVVAGFLILRSISDDSSTSLGSGDGVSADGDAATNTTAAPGGSTSTTAATTTTQPAATFTGASVIVANDNRISGNAGQISTVLSNGTDFELVDPTNSSNAEASATSQILYDSSNAAAQAVAETLSAVLPGNITPAPISGTPPVTDGQLNGAGVVFMVGTDLAELTVAQLTDPTAAAAPAGTAPAVAGSNTSAPADG